MIAGFIFSRKRKQEEKLKATSSNENTHINNMIPGSSITENFYPENAANISEVCRRFEFKSRLHRIESKVYGKKDFQEEGSTAAHSKENTVRANMCSSSHEEDNSGKTYTDPYNDVPDNSKDRACEPDNNQWTAITENRAPNYSQVKTDLQLTCSQGKEPACDLECNEGQKLRSKSTKRKHHRLSENTELLSAEEKTSRSVRPSKSVKRSNCDLGDSSQEVDKQRENETGEQIVESVSVDDYGDVCLDNIR